MLCRTILSSAAVSLLILIAGACQPHDATPTPLEYSLPGSPIHAKAGQEFRIRLAANATTGYEWQVATPADPKIATLVKSEYVTASPDGPPGSGGEQVFTFRAVGEGQTKIQLKYVRPWEKDTTPGKTADFDLTVEPGA